MQFLVCKYLIDPMMQRVADDHPQAVKQCAKVPGIRCERCGVYNSIGGC